MTQQEEKDELYKALDQLQLRGDYEELNQVVAYATAAVENDQ